MIVSCVGVSLGYNLCAGLLRAVGDSLTALYFLIFSALVNIILDFFITQLHLGVQSAGLATIISQGLSAIICLYYIKKKVTFLLLHKSDFVLDSSLYLDLFGQGMAMGLMNSIVSIGTVTLQYVLTSHHQCSGGSKTNYVLCGSTLDLPCCWVTTFTSQNFGAQQFKRIVEGSKQSCLVSIIWSIIACVLLYMISPFLAGLISGSDNAMIINNADRYLRISSLFILFWEYSSSLEIVSRGQVKNSHQKPLALLSFLVKFSLLCLSFFIWAILALSYVNHCFGFL